VEIGRPMITKMTCSGSSWYVKAHSPANSLSDVSSLSREISTRVVYCLITIKSHILDIMIKEQMSLHRLM
jgi:hypothetical protein